MLKVSDCGSLRDLVYVCPLSANGNVVLAVWQVTVSDACSVFSFLATLL